MMSSIQEEFEFALLPQHEPMELLCRLFVCIAKIHLQQPCQEAHSSEPRSAQPPVPLNSSSGKKARRARKKLKERVPEESPFPLSMLSCVMKRRISEVYADMYRANKMTEDLVNEFINCLIDARNELLQRYENVQRSFKIKKAMLSNHQNYRSSHGRLLEQLCRLETERDNLQKDAAIYNSLQERLQASAPYRMIMALGAEMEVPEISFEELLAKEKEDTAFWQKMRSTSSK